MKYIINKTDNDVINLDKLTYAGNLRSLETISDNKRYSFEKVDIKDFDEMLEAFNKYKPDSVMHLAAESHVDRSISGPEGFIQTNIVGTYVLLEVVKKYFYNLNKTKRSHFKFHHISTDEVYGDIGFSGDPSKENNRYKPSSPYSASKASSDHLVRSWSRTYKLPFVITNSSNNYGPYHYPEKLIPLTIKNALEGKDIPVYVYCRSGGRSASAARKMEELGFVKVYNLDGGIGGWNAANYMAVTSKKEKKGNA